MVEGRGNQAQCRHGTVTPDPGLVNPKSYIEVPGSLLPLLLSVSRVSLVVCLGSRVSLRYLLGMLCFVSRVPIWCLLGLWGCFLGASWVSTKVYLSVSLECL